MDIHFQWRHKLEEYRSFAISKILRFVFQNVHAHMQVFPFLVTEFNKSGNSKLWINRRAQ